MNRLTSVVLIVLAAGMHLGCAAQSASVVVRSDRSPSDSIPDSQSPGVTPPRLIDARGLRYPKSALRARAEGRGTARLLIDERGHVTRAELIESSGVDALDNAALESALNMKFQPASQGGSAIQVWQVWPFEFRLSN